MEENLQDFLRKAAERRRQQSGQPAQPAPVQPARPTPPPEIEIIEATVPVAEPIRLTTPLTSGIEIIEDEPVDLEPIRLAPEKLDSQIDTHLHDVFDHRVGNLGSRSVTDSVYEEASNEETFSVDDKDAYTAPKKKQSSFIQGILSSPSNLRTAFIFSEIIRRPTDRWKRS